MNKPGDYSIGSNKLPGLAKMAEECGELIQVIGKLIATGGESQYYDGTELHQRLIEEMTDVIAAITFFDEVNRLGANRQRFDAKLAQFKAWHAEQITKCKRICTCEPDGTRNFWCLLHGG